MPGPRSETFSTGDHAALVELREALKARLVVLSEMPPQKHGGVNYKLNIVREMLGEVGECIDAIREHWGDKSV